MSPLCCVDTYLIDSLRLKVRIDTASIKACVIQRTEAGFGVFAGPDEGPTVLYAFSFSCHWGKYEITGSERYLSRFRRREISLCIVSDDVAFPGKPAAVMVSVRYLGRTCPSLAISIALHSPVISPVALRLNSSASSMRLRVLKRSA